MNTKTYYKPNERLIRLVVFSLDQHRKEFREEYESKNGIFSLQEETDNSVIVYSDIPGQGCWDMHKACIVTYKDYVPFDFSIPHEVFKL